MDQEELENEETWDLANAEQHEPAKNRRSVVSVAYRPEQFAEVAQRARDAGMKLSEYIRNRSLADASENIETAGIMITGGQGASAIFRLESFAPVTSSVSPEEEAEIEITANAEVRALAS